MSVTGIGCGVSAHAMHERMESSIRNSMCLRKMRREEVELSAVSMRQDIEKLYMIVEALWSVVKKSANLKDDDLVELVRQVDLQDGKLDGRNAENLAVRTCASCGKVLLQGQTTCAYCGKTLEGGDLFRHNG